MFALSSIAFWAMLAGWAQVVVLIVTARFVWRYLQETARLRETAQAQVEVSQRQVAAAYEQLAAVRQQNAAAQDQLEGQIRPAIVVRDKGGPVGLELVNVGKGPALHIKLFATERDATPKSGLNRFPAEIGIVGVGGSSPVGVHSQGENINALNGRSLQCEYMSLSNRTYWTIVDFDKADNARLIATRFYSEAR